MPTIGVYFSEMEYMEIVTLISKNEEKVSDYIHDTVMKEVNKS